MSKLTSYRDKRNFDRTSEPRGEHGGKTASANHPRFIVQKHEARRLHYDLRLEIDGVLASWAVTRGPSLDPKQRRLAVAVEDHPLEYGDFEGSIPKGEYGAGTVMIWDRGFWQPEDPTTSPRQSIEAGELKFALAGSKLAGSFVLVKLNGEKGPRGRDNWLLIKHRDAYAKPNGADVLDHDLSVASGRSMAQIAAGKAPMPTRFFSGRRTDGPAARKSKSVPGPQDKIDASFAGWADDLPARAGVSAHVAGVRISSPDKLLWPAGDSPGVTKLALASYLAAVSPWMLEHIRGRPCSILRMPDGIEGQGFFQRHVASSTPDFVTRITVSGDREPYLQIDDVASLVAMGQLAALEFHPWGSQPGRPDVPGRLVLDLDPGEALPFRKVVEAALDMRTRLEKVGLVPFCKTSGGKGLHVVVPLAEERRPPSWEQAKLFAQTLCAQAASDSPSRYVVKMTKSIRKGRVFLDYLRNDHTATAVAPLSPRARPGATVSMPLKWPDVTATLDPNDFTIWTAIAILEERKPWRDYSQSAMPLSAAIRRLTSHST